MGLPRTFLQVIDNPQDTFLQLLRIFGFAFPNSVDPPSVGSESTHIATIPLDVSEPLLCPKAAVRRRLRLAICAFMHMPEAAVYKDDGTMFRDDDIGASGHVATVQAITNAECMKGFPDLQLRSSSFVTNRSHVAAALLRRVYIGGHESEMRASAMWRQRV
jgi:hypothetical protein